MPKLSEWLFGKKDKTKQLKTTSKEQDQLMQLIQQGLQSGEGPLADIFGKFNEKEFAEGVTNPAMKDFKEKILPMLQEKFIGGGQVGGSGMLRGQEQAGTDLMSKLAELKYQAQQGQKQNKIAGTQQLLGMKPVENMYQKGYAGAANEFVGGVGKGLGQAAGAAIAG